MLIQDWKCQVMIQRQKVRRVQVKVDEIKWRRVQDIRLDCSLLRLDSSSKPLDSSTLLPRVSPARFLLALSTKRVSPLYGSYQLDCFGSASQWIWSVQLGTNLLSALERRMKSPNEDYDLENLFWGLNAQQFVLEHFHTLLTRNQFRPRQAQTLLQNVWVALNPMQRSILNWHGLSSLREWIIARHNQLQQGEQAQWDIAYHVTLR